MIFLPFKRASGIKNHNAVFKNQPKPSLIRATSPVTDSDDMPPEEHAHKWDFIESASKKCWIHKITSKKICVNK